jgi:DNA-binding transcriptional LysR family regulator
LDRRRLECFIALAEELHFSRAARRAGISQPGLSQQLRQLESHLQVHLVSRNKRHVALTRAGEVFLAQARKIVADMSDAVELARRTEEGSLGTLRLGVTPSSLFITAPEIIAEFHRAHPEVHLDVRQLSTDEQVEALRSGDIEVGLLHPPLSDTSLHCRLLFEEPFKVALCDARPLASKREIALTDLADQTFIMFPRGIGPQLYDDIIARCHGAGFSPRKIIEVSPAQSIVALAACNLGIGFVAAEVQHYNRPLATYRPLTGDGPALKIAAAFPQSEPAAMALQFVEAGLAARARHWQSPRQRPTDKRVA